MATGTAILDFGVFPGASDASVAVTGQTSIATTSLVEAWLRPQATADHSADEHLVETLKVVAGNIVGGTGFTVYGVNTNQINEPVEPGNRGGGGGQGTRISGTWSLAWAWS